MKRKPARGRTVKHAHKGNSAGKHGGTGKHHPGRHPHHAGLQLPGSPVHVTGVLPGPPKPRKLALGDEVACCAAEALAASLRLTGVRVSDDNVLALYAHNAHGPDDGASISATLAAAAEFGLAGWRPLICTDPRDSMAIAGAGPASTRSLALSGRCYTVLGVDLPGSHAVTVGPDGAWWSWGEPHDPAEWPDAVVEEAWAVAWQ